MLDPLPLKRCSTVLGNSWVRSVAPFSSSVMALSDARRPPSCSACRKADRWSGTGVGSPLRVKSDSSVSSPSSSSRRNEGRTGVISKKPAARCHDRAKLLMLLTPPTSPNALNCCPTEDLRLFLLVVVHSRNAS
ncbi:Vacuolar amino acid transporter 1 [Alternaria alternata]|nr:Vacuolar amino acid transporter 1 [Alternaria alternata]